ncbi:MAG TPA: hypothetical protein VFJ16_13605 [Longimicrobium sp.]|nr:hypothetical protein [Longimicrobium sp.]
MVTIFVEGTAEQNLLGRLLADLPAAVNVRVVAAGNADDARPRARKELLFHQRPTLLVIDADSVDADRVEQQQRELEAYLAWGGNGLPYQVVQFVPTMEAVFFDAPDVLEHLVGRKVDELMLAAGEIAPKAVLQRIGVPDVEARLDRLTADDIRKLRGHPAIAAIREFVQAHAEPEPLRRSA